MVERIKFAGDPEIKETGSGQEPQIPLNRTVPPVSVEMLNKDGEEKPPENVDFRKKPPQGKQQADDDDDDDEPEADGPDYSRERTGARIGQSMEDAQTVAAVEEQLDTEDVVPMLFPHKVMLQDKGIMHTFNPGVHMVPVSLAGATKKDTHWYLKAHGVKRTQKNPIPRPKVEEADDE